MQSMHSALEVACGGLNPLHHFLLTLACAHVYRNRPAHLTLYDATCWAAACDASWFHRLYQLLERRVGRVPESNFGRFARMNSEPIGVCEVDLEDLVRLAGLGDARTQNLLIHMLTSGDLDLAIGISRCAIKHDVVSLMKHVVLPTRCIWEDACIYGSLHVLIYLLATTETATCAYMCLYHVMALPVSPYIQSILLGFLRLRRSVIPALPYECDKHALSVGCAYKGVDFIQNMRQFVVVEHWLDMKILYNTMDWDLFEFANSMVPYAKHASFQKFMIPIKDRSKLHIGVLHAVRSGVLRISQYAQICVNFGDTVMLDYGLEFPNWKQVLYDTTLITLAKLRARNRKVRTPEILRVLTWLHTNKMRVNTMLAVLDIKKRDAIMEILHDHRFYCVQRAKLYRICESDGKYHYHVNSMSSTDYMNW